MRTGGFIVFLGDAIFEVRHKPALPGYVFVELDGEDWSEAAHTNGVVSILMAGDVPAKVETEELAPLDKTSNLELKVLDGDGIAIATLVYGLTNITPSDFDLALLSVAWDTWREGAR